MSQMALMVAYWVVGAVLTLGSAYGWAGPIIGYPTTAGTGCPSGTVTAVLSPDRDELSIMFDQYTIEGTPSRRAESKVCEIEIPITIPEGEELEVVGADMRGFVSVPAGGFAGFDVRYLFGPTRRQRPVDNVRMRVHGPKDMDFIANGKVSSRYRTHCNGGTFYLVLNTTMDLNLRNSIESGLITLDSADVYKPDSGRKISFGYLTEKCRGHGRGRGKKGR